MSSVKKTDFIFKIWVNDFVIVRNALTILFWKLEGVDLI